MLQTNNPLLTLKQLSDKLSEQGISPDCYYLHGLYGSINDEEKYGLAIKRGKYTIEYEVYYKERGEKHSSRLFIDEHEACDWIYTLLIDEQTSNRIQNINGLLGMTVNERLYASGLMDEFDTARLTNKSRAKQILRWLRVDEKSIEHIIIESE
ncbi:hypothetical protein [Pedobacter nyackensis]|uniref:Immunity protein 63 n=1 Tax=Pedobacter nyackensis TaxID=475255 RepID=A0A1W2AJ37_9SPHI|nr:hypothetical protein [Pedobacter nyackensis]SMC60715.1 hypothetical protein SAMN04488101_101661 [Pedobacter nyackensis]